ncbi:hypothetical protein IV203_020990 [Nitzschia inconspicua]|uniref:Uncharacterized protein n=1 Tax=Nitzschia inconspicua TaxID=303405 RepID=A0A9K3PDJ1_9STRA|nr:hypothetical protein IV203_020990 [Nitzschia inconspicua]
MSAMKMINAWMLGSPPNILAMSTSNTLQFRIGKKPVALCFATSRVPSTHLMTSPNLLDGYKYFITIMPEDLWDIMLSFFRHPLLSIVLSSLFLCIAD